MAGLYLLECGIDRIGSVGSERHPYPPTHQKAVSIGRGFSSFTNDDTASKSVVPYKILFLGGTKIEISEFS